MTGVASEGVPTAIVFAIDNYVENRYPLGYFLRAVVANDLLGASGSADDENGAALQRIARYVFNNVPGRARGSYAAVDQWLAGTSGEKK